VSFCQSEGIVISAYCPLVRNQKAEDPTLLSLAQKYNKSTAQILVRYSLQKDWTPLPKSETPSRIASNAEVFDFNLDDAEMEKLDALDEGAKGQSDYIKYNHTNAPRTY
jgi:diketogulonate reductase-like aldo/keto reductase